jgi:hypothetical protein
MGYTWHRLKAGLLRHSGAEHQNSYWVPGNKPHPPREVDASGFHLPFYFARTARVLPFLPKPSDAPVLLSH